MLETFARWLNKKWDFDSKPDALLLAYFNAFTLPDGQIVLQDLIDKYYAVSPDGGDEIALAWHCGQRSVIHAILQNIDMAKNGEKYKIKINGGKQ